MSAHAKFSPSRAHRDLECPGNRAYKANHGDEGSSPYADEGSAAHLVGSGALESMEACSQWVGGWAYPVILTGDDGEPYEEWRYERAARGKQRARSVLVTEEMADDVQVYVDEVNRRRMDRPSWIEQRVDISHALRMPNQFGTADCVIAHPEDRLLEVIDLKFGKGEKVYAKRNYQLMLYALGALRLPELDLIYEFDRVRVCIAQVRLSPEFEEWECSLEELLEFQQWAWPRVQQADHIQSTSVMHGEQRAVAVARENNLIRPGEKQCRWCKAKATCEVLAEFVQAQVAADFEVIAADEPKVPDSAKQIGIAMAAVPLIELWCKAVRDEAGAMVDNGLQIIGTDGLPMKFVEGKGGKRKWNDELAAEALLVGQLGPAAYQPQKLITAPAAAKKLDKQRTAAIWEHFKPLITKGSGKRVLVLGSDPRPPYQGAASADEFDDESESE